MIQLGIFARTWGDTIDVQPLFRQISSHGLSQVHFNMLCCGLTEQPTEIPEDTLKEVNAASKAHGLGIAGLSSTFNMIHPDPKVIKNGIASLGVLAASCHVLGCTFLSLCSGTRNAMDKWKWHPDNTTSESWRQLLQTLEIALLIAEKYEVYLGVEPETANVVCNARQAHRLLSEMQSDRLQIILDPANLFVVAKSKDEITALMLDAFELLQDNIAMVHAKDRKLSGEIKAPGKGDIDFEFFSKCLNQAQFEGAMIMHGLTENEVSGSVQYLNEIIS